MEGEQVMGKALKKPLTDSGAESFRLVSSDSGTLDGLRLEHATRQSPGPDQVEIAVSAAGLNFPDLMHAMGVFPEMPETPILLGGENPEEKLSISLTF